MIKIFVCNSLEKSEILINPVLLSTNLLIIIVTRCSLEIHHNIYLYKIFFFYELLKTSFIYHVLKLEITWTLIKWIVTYYFVLLMRLSRYYYKIYF